MIPSKEEVQFSFDETFQCSVLYMLTVSQEFFYKYSDYIRPHYFTNISSGRMFTNLNQFYTEQGKIPTFEELSDMIANLKDIEDISDYKKKVTEVRNSAPTTPEFVEQVIMTFCKRQQMILAVEESIDLIEKGNFDKIKDNVDKALDIGSKKEVGYDFFSDDNFNERRTTQSRSTLKTLIRELDKHLKGGIGVGELMIFLALPKKGKTTTMINIASAALYQGKFVVYVTLEMSERSIAERFEARFTGLSSINSDNQEGAKSRINKIKNRGSMLYIKNHPSGTLTIDRLRKDLEYIQLQAERKIDLLVVDYMTIMRTKSGTVSTDDWSQLSVELRGLAGEFDMRVVTAIQSNRGGSGKETLEMGDISKCFEIAGIADCIISINQTPAERERDIARLHIVANREGTSDVDVTIKMLRELCTVVEMDNVAPLPAVEQAAMMKSVREGLSRDEFYTP